MQSGAAVTVTSLVNPVICGAIFSSLVAGKPIGAKISGATKAVLVVAVILCLASRTDVDGIPHARLAVPVTALAAIVVALALNWRAPAE